VKRSVLVIILAACSAPAQRPPIESAGGQPAAAAPVQEASCCCTFAFAEPEDFPDVNTWVLPENACRSGTPSRMHGQCIDAKFCAGVQPDPPVLPPMEEGQCCCDVFDGQGESTSVTEASACSNCVDPGFCDRPAS
jgi:hypothetical protein